MLPSGTIRLGGRTPRTLAIASLAVALGGAGAITALAASDDPEPTLHAARHRVPAGGTVVLRGRSFPQRAHIVLRVGRVHHRLRRVGAARTGLRGGFVAPIEIEESARRGRYVALACHDHCRVQARTRFRIVRP